MKCLGKIIYIEIMAKIIIEIKPKWIPDIDLILDSIKDEYKDEILSIKIIN